MITVVYYTSNREDETFEVKIREKLLNVIGGLPLISVSQKPLDFGYNICVGDIGTSDKNVLYQLLIGCRAAETSFVAAAEADFLYPPTGYFDFDPEDVNAVYRYTNLWILAHNWEHYKRKEYSLGAQIAGRVYLMDCIKDRLGEIPVRGDIVDKRNGWRPFENILPCVSIKTGRGMRRRTGTVKDSLPEDSLPYWGSAVELRKGLLNN